MSRGVRRALPATSRRCRRDRRFARCRSRGSHRRCGARQDVALRGAAGRAARRQPLGSERARARSRSRCSTINRLRSSESGAASTDLTSATGICRPRGRADHLGERVERDLVLDSPSGGRRNVRGVAVPAATTTTKQEVPVSNTGSISGLEEVPDMIRRYFVLDADRDIESRSWLCSATTQRSSTKAKRDMGPWRFGLAGRASVAIHVHDRCARHRRAQRRPARRHGPADGQFPWRHRRAEVGLHRRRRPSQPTGHRTMTSAPSIQTLGPRWSC